MLRKIFTLTAIIFIMVIVTPKVFAYELSWYDKNTDVKKFTKIILFPLSYDYDSTPADSYFSDDSANAYILERLSKKFKKINFVPSYNERNYQDALANLHAELLKNFPDTNNINLADLSGLDADMYIVPILRENSTQSDISPSKEWDVRLKSWTEESGGPRGYRIYGEMSRNVHHVIPERTITLRNMQVEFVGYNKDAQIIMTSLQQDFSYGTSEEKPFQKLVNNFQKSFSDAPKVKKSKPGKVSVAFDPITIEGDMNGDIFFGNAMEDSLQNMVLKRIKHSNIIEDSSQQADYYVRSTITQFELKSRWVEPSYSISDQKGFSRSQTWKDKDGNEHEMTTTNYTQTINDYYAHWVFSWAMTGKFELLDSGGNVVLSKTYNNVDSKPLDAYRHVTEKFCNDLKMYFKN